MYVDNLKSVHGPHWGSLGPHYIDVMYIQSNSIIENSMGTSVSVCYNCEITKIVKLYVKTKNLGPINSIKFVCNSYEFVVTSL